MFGTHLMSLVAKRCLCVEAISNNENVQALPLLCMVGLWHVKATTIYVLNPHHTLPMVLAQDPINPCVQNGTFCLGL